MTTIPARSPESWTGGISITKKNVRHGSNARPTGAYGTPGAYYVPTHARKKPLRDLTPQEVLVFLQDLRQRLQAKQARERAYLDRRAARGTHTPTDEAYEGDQLLEQDLLDLLDQLITTAQEEDL